MHKFNLKIQFCPKKIIKQTQNLAQDKKKWKYVDKRILSQLKNDTTQNADITTT